MANAFVMLLRTVLIEYIGNPQWIGLIDLDECLLALFHSSTQTTEHNIDPLVFPIRSLLKFIEVVHLYQLDSVKKRSPLLEFATYDANNLSPSVVGCQCLDKFLNLAVTVPVRQPRCLRTPMLPTF